MDEDRLDRPHHTISWYEVFIMKCINRSIHRFELWKHYFICTYVNIIIIIIIIIIMY